MSIAENYQQIKQDITAARAHFYCADGEQDMPDYAPAIGASTIIAVSKQQSADVIDEALLAGLRHFGENKLQEAQAHWHIKRESDDYPDLKLHMIGPIQSNKVKDVVRLFDVIHTIDREKIAKALSKEMQAQGRNLPCLIQVNIGEEPQKHGIMPQDLADFLAYCRGDLALNIEGLMCIPPPAGPAGHYFSLLRSYADENGLEKLSMGMSADYCEAALLGADYIRIGSALLGARG